MSTLFRRAYKYRTESTNPQPPNPTDSGTDIYIYMSNETTHSHVHHQSLLSPPSYQLSSNLASKRYQHVYVCVLILSVEWIESSSSSSSSSYLYHCFPRWTDCESDRNREIILWHHYASFRLRSKEFCWQPVHLTDGIPRFYGFLLVPCFFWGVSEQCPRQKPSTRLDDDDNTGGTRTHRPSYIPPQKNRSVPHRRRTRFRRDFMDSLGFFGVVVSSGFLAVR